MNEPLIVDNRFSEILSRDIADYPNGILFPVDKPYRWTSSDVVRKMKFALQKNFSLKKLKIGHAGTLDPLATGLLIVCVGKATKLAETLQNHEKEYIAEVSFGATTPSFDLEKQIDKHFPCDHITKELVEEACKTFIGEQEQVPPMFSAKYVDGVRAYEYAREGESIPLKASKITISEIEVLDFNPKYVAKKTQSPIRKETAQEEEIVVDYPRPMATIRLKCSKGTYIRSFARDLGLALNSGAYLNGLQRTISGNFLIKNANSLDNLISTNYFCSLN